MTTVITTAHAITTAPPAALFDRWADMATWPEWSTDMDWARLDGPFAVGTTGVLKPTRGPKTKFVIEQLDPGRVYVDVSRLPGARLTFDHRVADLPGGGCSVDVTVSLSGPLSRLWMLVLARDLRASTQADLDRLVATVGTGV